MTDEKVKRALIARGGRSPESGSKKPHFFDAAAEKKVVRAFHDGQSASAIATFYGCSPKTVMKVLWRAGVSTSRAKWRDAHRASANVHGQTKRGRPSCEFIVWWGMLERCLNPCNRAYSQYGARGIKVCARWRKSFKAFLADMGARPSSQHQIDRIDNASGYRLGNCRWATRKEQARNKSTTRYLSFKGERLSIAEWAERTGLDYNVLYQRLNYGWSVKNALTRPTRKLQRAA